MNVNLKTAVIKSSILFSSLILVSSAQALTVQEAFGEAVYFDTIYLNL